MRSSRLFASAPCGIGVTLPFCHRAMVFKRSGWYLSNCLVICFSVTTQCCKEPVVHFCFTELNCKYEDLQSGSGSGSFAEFPDSRLQSTKVDGDGSIVAPAPAVTVPCAPAADTCNASSWALRDDDADDADEEAEEEEEQNDTEHTADAGGDGPSAVALMCCMCGLQAGEACPLDSFVGRVPKKRREDIPGQAHL